ncbi:hypothetical protein GCM10009838_44030 [Catenulispora subtropica]|uniref:Uncharacterized protein n=1 Tax=Catenulispora subtropica TaxID=450798 RepID=A0ABP5DFZ8_9ACTN
MPPPLAENPMEVLFQVSPAGGAPKELQGDRTRGPELGEASFDPHAVPDLHAVSIHGADRVDEGGAALVSHLFRTPSPAAE